MACVDGSAPAEAPGPEADGGAAAANPWARVHGAAR